MNRPERLCVALVVLAILCTISAIKRPQTANMEEIALTYAEIGHQHGVAGYSWAYTANKLFNYWED